VSYSSLSEEQIAIVKNKIKPNGRYDDAFRITALVAFLLHMWRDAEDLDNLDAEEKASSRRRIYKYSELLKSALRAEETCEYPPAYHYIALLRGIMLANVIEHSFWKIHTLLDPDFRVFGSVVASEKARSPRGLENDGKWYTIFVVTHGMTSADGKRIVFNPLRGPHRFFCFEFDGEESLRDFLRVRLKEVLKTNGTALKRMKADPGIRSLTLGRVSWLNKSTEPRATEFVRLQIKEDSRYSDHWVPIDRVRIYFTGYRFKCPGPKEGTCSHGYGSQGRCQEGRRRCKVLDSGTRHPDVARLVVFEDHVQQLDSSLKGLIADRIHQTSRIARMNDMGNKVIRALLDLYLRNPRLMHDRVWTRLREYRGTRARATVKTWIDLPLAEKDRKVLPEDILDSLKDTKISKHRYMLVRRIIEHISGMTDRYISAEYNRFVLSGREAELQDETYFFS
jgi:hypothetical protein